jgi:hypothetical protein
MIESNRLIYTPSWLKAVALATLAAALFSATYFTFHFISRDNPADPKFTDWILIGMQIIHMSLSGFTIALIVFFSERQASHTLLEKETEKFLTDLLPRQLTRVTPTYNLRAGKSTVRNLGRADIFGSAYNIKDESGAHEINVWIGINVGRIFAIFWIKTPEGTPATEEYINQLQKTFSFTFGGAEKVGYHTYFEPATVGNGESLENIVSIWSSADTKQNLLLNQSEQLFWLQDIAMMIESFWRTAIRSGITISSQEPSPL